MSSGGISWEAKNRTLLFEVTTRTTVQLRLLGTAAPADSLLASSTRIPIPSTHLDQQHLHRMIVGVPLITGDDTRLVARSSIRLPRPGEMFSRSPSSRCAPESPYRSWTGGGPPGIQAPQACRG